MVTSILPQTLLSAAKTPEERVVASMIDETPNRCLVGPLTRSQLRIAEELIARTTRLAPAVTLIPLQSLIADR